MIIQPDCGYVRSCKSRWGSEIDHVRMSLTKSGDGYHQSDPIDMSGTEAVELQSSPNAAPAVKAAHRTTYARLT
jgi:hypothetical protein